MLKVAVKFVDGKSLDVEVHENDDVDGLKEVVREKHGFEVDKQRLMWKGNQLDGGRTWRDYNLQVQEKPLNIAIVIK
eukprot:Skav217455  [mRNA]  locus=scaffold1289:76507:76737:- [translate_table: standard]